MKVTVGNDPVSEYDNVAALIQDAFPDLFPCGLTAEMAGGKANLSIMVMRLIFFHTDPRWATCPDFIMYLTDMELRHTVARGASVEVARGSDKVKALIGLINEPGFRDRLASAKNNPASSDAKKLRGTLLPLLRRINKKATWTQMERQDAISELYAMYYAYGNTMMYYTFNPRLLDDPLSVRLCARDTTLFGNGEEAKRAEIRRGGYDWVDTGGFPTTKRAQHCYKAIPSNRREALTALLLQ